MKQWIERNKITIYWVLGILMALMLFFPDKAINLTTQSLIGTGGTTLTVGIILLIGGLILFVVYPPSAIISVPFFIIAWSVTSVGGIITLIGKLISSLEGIIILVFILAILYFLMKRRRR